MSHVTDLLSEHMAGALPPAQASAVAAHLRGCAECREVLADLELIRARASALPPLEPPRDLWPELRARLAPRAPEPVVPLRPRRAQLRLSIPQALAASLAFLVAGGLGTWAAFGRTAPEGTRAAAPTPVLQSAAPAAVPVSVDAAAPPELSEELARLEAALAGAEEILAPETLRVVRRNLEVIDRAIAESQAALANDPSDTYLRSHLEGTYRRKVRYLEAALTVSS